MAGRIVDEDVVAVRERARIDEVVSGYLQLRNAGGGSKKGLCPFHDEKTPSFQVTPSRGLFYCFGCGEGGDVITFVQKVDNLGFTEAVQRLADKVGITLRFTEGGGPSVAPGLRMRLLEANLQAAEFFAEQLSSPDAVVARRFLDSRGFDRAAAERFGVGFAPRGGRRLADHLRGRGFSHAELVTAGLIRDKGWDFFQGRAIWPIRDSSTSVLGFGARRLFDDDRMPAKYLNTPETPLYKKSHVLYGLDLARTPIGKTSQAVIVEGYTDVMACHLAGVETAVASCGTAFGDDHAKLLRRLMGDHDAFGGEVIFTFDGDAAGQAAAMKVFAGDANFQAQTYVAIEPTGLDPCDLRIQHGDAQVRELIGRRVPLYRFVMGNVIAGFDLDRVEGRVQALRAAAPLVGSIRDRSMVGGYVRELAQLIGMDIEEVRSEVQRAAARGPVTDRRSGRPESGRRESGRSEANRTESGRGDLRRWGDDDRSAGRSRDGRTGGPADERGPGPDDPGPEPRDDGAAAAPRRRPDDLPDPADRDLVVERETCKLLLQHPTSFGGDWHQLVAEDFAHPAYRAVFTAARTTPNDPASPGWLDAVRGSVTDERLDGLLVSLAVESIATNREVDARYSSAWAAKLRLIQTLRRIADLKSRLQRTNPVTEGDRHRQMFSTLLGLETLRAQLQQAALGTTE